MAKRWNVGLVQTLFWEEDAKMILSIAVAAHDTQDVRVWHYTKHGTFLVKTVYYIAQHIRQQDLYARKGSPSSSEDFNWDSVWKINLPNKIKVFFWRLLKLALPVLQNLYKTHVVTDVLCSVCKCGEESVFHIFTECHYARIFWALSPISNSVYVPAARNVRDWICAMLQAMSRDWIGALRS